MANITLILALWIHVLSAIAWLGGLVILDRIIIPSFIQNTTENKADFFINITQKYSLLIVIANILILITGLYLVYTYDYLNINQLINTSYGNFLLLKISLYVIFTALGVVIGKNLSKIKQDFSEEKALSIINKTKPLLKIDLVIGLVIIFIAVILRFSGNVTL